MRHESRVSSLHLQAADVHAEQGHDDSEVGKDESSAADEVTKVEILAATTEVTPRKRLENTHMIKR